MRLYSATALSNISLAFSAFFDNSKLYIHRLSDLQHPNILFDFYRKKSLPYYTAPLIAKHQSRRGEDSHPEGRLRQPITITVRPLEEKELSALGGKGNVGMDRGL